MGKDYYKILGVEKGATENELKKGMLEFYKPVAVSYASYVLQSLD